MDANADTLITTRFDTVIYDLDGTLIDSARDMRVAVSRVLADHGLPPISDDEARIFMGEGSKITMRRAFAKNGRGEFAFGAVNATMELGYARRIVSFNWMGFDEGDEICGSGSAELEDDGTIEIELSFHNGDDAILKARRE